MIGDLTKLLNAVRNPLNLRKAFQYALRDRLLDHYYDPFELEHASKNEEAIVAELVQELNDPNSYSPKPAYAYYPPKNTLCYRRMVYIPFKDLVVRYAFVIVFSNLLDPELSTHCFANRRARGEAAQCQFLQDFANVCWPRFCEWQKKCAANRAFTTLLRTDISAFYDSVSHRYLVSTLEGQLAIQPGSKLMRLFRKLLRIPVISYYQLSGKLVDPQIMHQGLAIGNNTEGVLANLYLKTIDEAMAKIKGISFGRYNDDIRIFAKDRHSAKQAMFVLQEHLLTKGLNLNASKTRIEEGPRGMEALRSKAFEDYDYFTEEDDLAETTGITVTDHPFDEFTRQFKPGEEFKDDKDAKDFCHFLGRVLGIEDRQPVHVDMLKIVLTTWHGSSKYASWRLVETIVRDQCPASTKAQATKTLLSCLADRDVSPYAKYRLLHYLLRSRRRVGGSGTCRLFDLLNFRAKTEIKQMLPRFLSEPAFELNIIALYAMQVLGASHAEMKVAAKRYSPKTYWHSHQECPHLDRRGNSTCGAIQFGGCLRKRGPRRLPLNWHENRCQSSCRGSAPRKHVKTGVSRYFRAAFLTPYPHNDWRAGIVTWQIRTRGGKPRQGPATGSGPVGRPDPARDGNT